MQSLKHVRLWLLYRCCLGIVVFCLRVFRVLPIGLFRIVSNPLLRVVAFFILPRGRIVKNLNQTLGDSYSFAAKKGLAKGVQAHFVKNIRDCLFHWIHPEETRSLISVKGIENLEAALSKGRGVIALGAHLGNFIMVGTRLGMDQYPFHTLIRFPADRGARSFIEKHASVFCQILIPSMPRRSAVESVLRLLKENQIVYILGDNFKRGRVPDRFYGQPVCSSRGPVSLAMRTGAVILPMYLIRNYQGRSELQIHPEISVSRTGRLPADIISNTHRITECLEVLVRRYPDQWNWITLRLEK